MIDAYCCAGGAAVGYARAGFRVIGVDINPQLRYPFEFHLGDAIEFIREHGANAHAVHASPPCQRYSRCTPQHAKERHHDLIAETREILVGLGVPYVIENVDTAKHLLRDPITLCGQQFGLRVLRHRCFESNVALVEPPKCSHVGLLEGRDYVSVHDGTMCSHSRKVMAAHGVPMDGKMCTAAFYQAAMGIDWMKTRKEIAEALPPAYTEFIGLQLLQALWKFSRTVLREGPFSTLQPPPGLQSLCGRGLSCPRVEPTCPNIPMAVFERSEAAIFLERTP